MICLWILDILEPSGEAQSHLDLLGYLDLKVFLWVVRPAIRGLQGCLQAFFSSLTLYTSGL